MRLLLSAVLVCLGAIPVAAQTSLADADAMGSGTPEAGKSIFTIYGFIRADAVYETSQPNDSQTVFFIPSQDPASGNKGHDDSFTLYTRLTRLGMKLSGPDVHGMPLEGRIEIDFQSGGTESQSRIRMRHAYFTLAKGDHLKFLVGQTDDLFSPLRPSVNEDTHNWNGGNTGDRRPQIRVTYSGEISDNAAFTVAGALALQGAVDGADRDFDGVLDGEDSGLPQVQLRAGYSRQLLKDSGDTHDFQVGIWYVRGQDETDVPVGSQDDFNSQLLGIDLTVPVIANRFGIRGELWAGKNVDDMRGGIGQGVNTTTGEEINACGWWLEGQFNLDETNTVFAGYSEDNPANGDLSPSTAGALSPSRNQIYYAGMKTLHFDPVEIGVEYMFYETSYIGFRRGTDHRFRTYISYKF